MKHFLRTVLFLIIISSPAFCQDKHPHLLLHFDVNETLISSDRAGNKTIDDVLNELLSKKYSAVWDDTLNESMTFEKYVHKIVYPIPEEDGDAYPGLGRKNELHKKRNWMCRHFIDYLKEHNHPLYEEVVKEHDDVLLVLRGSEGRVFPSFYRLLAELDEKQISYSIILRSFGLEIFEIRSEMEAFYNLNFDHSGKFSGGILHLEGLEPLTCHQEIYKILKSRGHIAIQDDWNHWAAYGFSSKYAKLFVYDPDDHETLSIFFDDNILNEEVTNIIAPSHATGGDAASISELAERGQLVRVDTLQAILDDNYYVKAVQNAMQKQSALHSK